MTGILVNEPIDQYHVMPMISPCNPFHSAESLPNTIVNAQFMLCDGRTA